PSTVRLTTLVSKGTRFTAAVGFEGAGQGSLEISVRRDGEPAVSLQRVAVKGGDRAAWTPLDLALDSFAGKMVTLELAALEATAGGRVLFGDPAIVTAREPKATRPRARLAVVVILSGVDRSRLVSPSYPMLADLSRTLADFEQHRAPTTVSAGVV